VEEQRRRNELIQYAVALPSNSVLSSFRTFKSIEERLRSLHEESEEKPTEDVQNDGGVSRLLGDIHEVINDYKVRSQLSNPPKC